MVRLKDFAEMLISFFRIYIYIYIYRKYKTSIKLKSWQNVLVWNEWVSQLDFNRAFHRKVRKVIPLRNSDDCFIDKESCHLIPAQHMNTLSQSYYAYLRDTAIVRRMSAGIWPTIGAGHYLTRRCWPFFFVPLKHQKDIQHVLYTNGYHNSTYTLNDLVNCSWG